MNGQTRDTQKKKWWTIGVLLLILAELCVALLLFLPQSKVLADVRTRKRVIVRKMENVRVGGEVFSETRKQIEDARNLLATVKLTSDQPAQGAMIEAVAVSLERAKVKIIEFGPIVTADRISAPTGSWKLKCRGRFGSLVRVLNEIELEGILFDSGHFRLQTTDEGDLEMEAVLKIFTPEAVAAEKKVDEAAAAKKPAKPLRKPGGTK